MSQHNHPSKGDVGCASERVLGEHIAYVMYRLMDPMEERHYWWVIQQAHEADIAELRRTKAPGYEHG